MSRRKIESRPLLWYIRGCSRGGRKTPSPGRRRSARQSRGKQEMIGLSDEKKKKGLFARLREGLSKTRGNMTEKVDEMVRDNRKIDDDFYEELEDILVMADCGLKATTVIIDELKARVKKQNVKDAASAREILKAIMTEQMDIPRPPLQWPMVMLMVGVNGVGKTTTIGKLALRFQSIGRRVMLCAGDTFRAAAAEQLTV